MFSMFPVVLLTVLCMLPLASSSASLSASQVSDIEDMISSMMSCLHVPAISLSVVTKDSVLLQRGYGKADIENNIEATQDTHFPIASTTKAFTATLLAILLQNSRLDCNIILSRL